jgi:hypothetical protein
MWAPSPWLVVVLCFVLWVLEEEGWGEEELSV